MSSIELLAPGIAKFSSCFELTESEIISLISDMDRSFEDNYEFVYDDNGCLLHGINKSHHKIPPEHIFALPVRIYDNLEFELVDKLEKAIHAKLLEYLLAYPDALRSIWWRTLGHVSAYPSGTCLDTHSDNDVNYRPQSTPIDQAAVQHVLSCTAVLNNEFKGGNLYFEYYDIDVELRAGDILFFPSNFVGAHCVKLVESGTRLSYVSWYGHGSPNEQTNINPRYFEDVGYAKGKIWMDNLFLEFDELTKEREHNLRRVFQRAYDH